MQIWDQTPPGIKLGLILLLGAVMIIAPSVFEWQWYLGIIRDFGTAIFITGALGLTIDRWLKTQIARDVFQAALGYILPEEYRAEILRIATLKFLCERHITRLQIEDIGDGQSNINC